MKIAIAASIIIMVGAAIIVHVESRVDKNSATIRSVLLKAMDRGYECATNGKAIEDCRADQIARWDALR